MICKGIHAIALVGWGGGGSRFPTSCAIRLRQIWGTLGFVALLFWNAEDAACDDTHD
jgi:hypothetical protein